MNKLVIFSTALVLASCGIRNKQTEEVVVEETIETEIGDIQLEENEEFEVVLPTERPVYRATETLLTDLIHTKLEVNFDWEQSRMNGIAWITAKPHFYASDSLILDAKGMDINSVAIGSKKLNFTYKNDFLRIKLDKEYTRNDRYTVMIDYVAKPDERETAGSAAITSDKGLYFINPRGEEPGKMPQIWTQGETEASSVWFPTIDQPNAKTTQEIFITVDEKYQTLSNGRLVSSKKIDGGKRVDHWKQDLPHAPYLFMMGVGEFKVVKDSYTRPNGEKMDVHYYVEPEWEAYAQSIFGETPEMIRFFSGLTGVEYPWDKYHQIVVRDYVSGAMENTGAVIFGDYVYKNDRELLDDNDQSTIAHELFHHWFGDLVTCESWSNLPLNESFANYSQYLWDEHRYGVDQADYYADIEAKGYYQTAQMQGYHDLIWFDYDDKEQMFDGHSYNKGGRILHMLRNYLGDEAFFAGMKNYLQTNKFKPAEFHQLRLAFEEVCGEDLNWFFNQWFLGSAHPNLEFRHELDTINNEVDITVFQKQDLELSPIYKLPMEIAYWDGNGKHVEKIVVDELEEAVSFPVSGDLEGIIFDNQQMLLAITSEDKTTDQYVHQYYNGERYMARRDGLLKGARDKENGQQLIIDALSDPFWDIRAEAVKKASILKGDLKTQGITILRHMVQNDPNSSVRSAVLAKLGNLLDKSEINEIYAYTIANDSSYSVVTTALTKLGKNDPESALALAKDLESEKSSKMLSGVGQLYAGHGGAEKLAFFQDGLSGGIVQGFDKLGMLSSLTYFLSRQEPAVADQAISMYEEASKTGGFYMQMFLPQNLSYLLNSFDRQISMLKIELGEHEESENALYADQTRKKIKEFNSVREKYNTLLEKVSEESESEGGH